MSGQVLVVIGAGGMGEAVARRLGQGRTVLLADVGERALDRAEEVLTGEGLAVVPHLVDVASVDSVRALASAAAAAGEVTQVVHTAGLSPVQAPVEAILAVDLLGVALVLDAFAPVVAPGGAGVVIASMAGHLTAPLTPEQEYALATTPSEDLLGLPFLAPDVITDTGTAYGVSKRANHVRVMAASTVWGQRGARVNSVSPGVISTAMGRAELDGPAGGTMRSLIGMSGTKRLGTPGDIAAATAFLLGPDATFVTGTDLTVDGGVVAAARTHVRAG
ncbi:SDR family oxidoreductase [Streptomyces corynorhini]|uniref:SDR family NAD(P)-dependent oxidoreductase n=1 Tax=Streptomyces corynorhini TaxID=2282652 RepID=A0A370B2F3_9ACTN|nr:SDR family oxidoreductase [Streptomyces corynorhini]RDG35998.1 SDR family NAD(P)-dependent oxidoreductase [Streptomyces corynorhini]